MSRRSGSGAGSSRVLRTRVKRSNIKESSRRWLERHLNDPYVQRSKADGYRSRSAYKLIEIDDRHHLLKPGRHVKYADETPITNLYMSMLDKMGVPVDAIGDSTGKLDGLSDL